MEVSKLPLTADPVSVQNATFGGSLIISHIGTAPFAGGETCKLLNAATSSGLFAKVSLLTLTQGLIWSTARLHVDGKV
jgi:hypothetical protein